ncbi:glycosyltransferase family 4 protein [Planococcus sp. FY231025]|uniref:glycosyltransferase family 4 protein n=1 Tax=Planococcus sp. FY231025 TaxID=3455699 RepID=UPI003F8FFF5A
MAAKILQAVTIAQSLKLMKGQLAYLESQGYSAKALSSSGKFIEEYEATEGVKVLTVEMEREISLLQDLKSLLACIRLIHQERPDIVSAGTPKAGLIVTLAAFLCGVPVRVYNVLGLRLETTSGLKRRILLLAEKIAALSATHVVAVSPSLKLQLVALGIANEEKISIFGQGSYNGFDLESFKQNEKLSVKISSLKKRYGLKESNTVIGFAGRMTKDKGIEEMVDAFLLLHEKDSGLRLLLMGDFEDGDPVNEATRKEIEENDAIIFAGYQHDPVAHYFLMDVFLFLTKREGFGNVSLEAALAGVPVVAADVTGAKDTVIDGKTGYLVDPNNPADVLEKVERLLNDPALRKRLGENGKAWGAANFSNQDIWREMDHFYRQQLAASSDALEQA